MAGVGVFFFLSFLFRISNSIWILYFMGENTHRVSQTGLFLQKDSGSRFICRYNIRSKHIPSLEPTAVGRSCTICNFNMKEPVVMIWLKFLTKILKQCYMFHLEQHQKFAIWERCSKSCFNLLFFCLFVSSKEIEKTSYPNGEDQENFGPIRGNFTTGSPNNNSF